MKLGRTRTNWSSHLSPTLSNFSDAGDLQENWCPYHRAVHILGLGLRETKGGDLAGTREATGLGAAPKPTRQVSRSVTTTCQLQQSLRPFIKVQSIKECLLPPNLERINFIANLTWNHSGERILGNLVPAKLR